MMALVTSKSGSSEPARETATAGPDDTNSNGGIFDGGLAAYKTTTEDDYRRLFTTGLVVLDANALLNLYRYHPKTRSDLLAVLGKLERRVWVAHHAMREFYENRENVIEGQSNELAGIVSRLRKSGTELQAAVNWWASRAGLPQEQLAELTQMSNDSVERIIAKLSELGADETFKDAEDTTTDPLVAELSSILDASVGPPLPENEFLAAREVARKRTASKIPPGWKDAGKSNNQEGDYLIWYETLKEAKRRGLDVLFVTGDVKEDWWYRSKGEAKGPLPELVAEMRAEADVQLYMLRPASLLIHARNILDLSVSNESVQDAERVGSWTTVFSTSNTSQGHYVANATMLPVHYVSTSDPAVVYTSGARLIKIGDVWDALGDIFGNDPDSAFRPVNAAAAMGTVHMEGPDGISVSLPNTGFRDWGMASGELLYVLGSWGVAPVPSGKYPAPPGTRPEEEFRPHGSVTSPST